MIDGFCPVKVCMFLDVVGCGRLAAKGPHSCLLTFPQQDWGRDWEEQEWESLWVEIKIGRSLANFTISWAKHLTWGKLTELIINQNKYFNYRLGCWISTFALALSQAQLHSRPLSPPLPLLLPQVTLAPCSEALSVWAVGVGLQSVCSGFSLPLFPSYAFPMLQHGLSPCCSEYLLCCGAPPLLTLVFPLLFLTPFCSLPSPFGVFCRFLNVFSQKHPKLHWWAQLWPAVGSMWIQLCSTLGSPWPLPTEATIAAPDTTKILPCTQYTRISLRMIPIPLFIQTPFPSSLLFNGIRASYI